MTELMGLDRPQTPPRPPSPRVEPALRLPFAVLAAGGPPPSGITEAERLSARDAFAEQLGRVIDGPVVFVDDVVPRRPPRAMWIVGGYVAKPLYGEASRAEDIDWVLVVDVIRRPVSCAPGQVGSVPDFRGRVVERKTGMVIGERVDRYDGDPCESGLMSVPAERFAMWAWTTLRNGASPRESPDEE